MIAIYYRDVLEALIVNEFIISLYALPVTSCDFATDASNKKSK